MQILVVQALQFSLYFLCVCLAPRHEVSEIHYIIDNLYVKREKCAITTDANAIYRMIAYKTAAVSDIFNALCCFNFLDDIKHTVELFAR